MDTPVLMQPSRRALGNQRAAVPLLLASLLTLSACGPDKPVGSVGHVSGFAGMVSADEPRAAIIGREVLSAGGSPADAAVAMAFTLSVTLPSQAGLGAGGSCLVFDHENKKVEALDFIAPSPAEISAQTSRPTAAPYLPRAMFALQAKYGHLRWEQLLAPAETLARTGTPASRAFVNQLAPIAGALFDDPLARKTFSRGDGTPLQEGELLQQLDLGATISRLRLRGAGDFYTGRGAEELLAASKAIGGSLTAEDLRVALPKWVSPIEVKYGDETAYFSPPAAASGLVEAEVWKLLAANKKYAQASAADRPHLLAEAFARVYGDRAHWMNPEGSSSQSPADVMAQGHIDGLWAGFSPTAHEAQGGDAPADVSAGTGITAIDNQGNAISCTLSMNNGFGTGRILPNYGFMLAFAPGVKGRGPYSVGPMLAINTNSNEFRFAAAAGGNTSSATALSQVALNALVGGQSLRDAMDAKRLHAVNSPDTVQLEADYPNGAALQASGHEVAEGVPLARVNALQCSSGRPKLSNCSAATDPRGSGMAIIVGKD